MVFSFSFYRFDIICFGCNTKYENVATIRAVHGEISHDYKLGLILDYGFYNSMSLFNLNYRHTVLN